MDEGAWGEDESPLHEQNQGNPRDGADDSADGRLSPSGRRGRRGHRGGVIGDRGERSREDHGPAGGDGQEHNDAHRHGHHDGADVPTDHSH